MLGDPSPSARGGSTRLRSSSDQVRFRRALTLLAMTLVVPGSAQLICGSRRVGRLATRLWIGALLLLGALALLAVVSNAAGLWLATNPVVLLAVRTVLTLAAIGWVLLLLDAWRLSDPPTMTQRRRLALAGVIAALTGLLAGPLLFGAHVVAVQRGVLLDVFGATAAADSHEGRYNVLLLGGDSGATRWGLRPDSVTLASIDAETGRTVLFGLPRNLADVPFPADSRMAAKFPAGFDCDECYFNGVYTYGVENPELFPGAEDPGLEATTQAVEEITGLPVHYYSMVNMQGFQDLVNAVGGVTLRVRTPIAIGGIGGDVTGTIQPGTRHLNGYETLWYARSRAYDDDYSRMGRQKCVLAAMLDQLSPQQVLLHVEDIAKASTELVSTDIPHRELDTFVALALQAKSQPITTLSFVPPMIDTSEPDYALIRDKVAAAIDKAEGESAPRGDAGSKRAGTASTKNARTDEAVEAANQSKDLGATC